MKNCECIQHDRENSLNGALQDSGNRSLLKRQCKILFSFSFDQNHSWSVSLSICLFCEHGYWSKNFPLRKKKKIGKKSWRHWNILFQVLAKNKHSIFLLGNSTAKINQPARENPSMNLSLASGSTKEQASEDRTLKLCLKSVGEFDGDTSEAEMWV